MTAIGFGLIFFTTVLGFSIQGANSLNNWAWGFDAIAVRWDSCPIGSGCANHSF